MKEGFIETPSRNRKKKRDRKTHERESRKAFSLRVALGQVKTQLYDIFKKV